MHAGARVRCAGRIAGGLAGATWRRSQGRSGFVGSWRDAMWWSVTARVSVVRA